MVILSIIIFSVLGIRFEVITLPTKEDMIREVIFENWLSKSGAGDFNNDGICNIEDYCMVITDDNYYKAWIILNPPKILVIHLTLDFYPSGFV